MNRGCDKMIVLGRLCGDALFLFALLAERSMPVPYIGDPDIKISDPHPRPDHTCFTRLPTTATLGQFAHRGSRQKTPDPHPGPTQRVLLDYRQLPHYDSLPAGAPGKKYRTAPRPDPTCFTRLPTTAILRQFGSGPCPGK